jgi:serine/threonine-protein kinase
VLLYELLTGERLFQGDDAADTLAQVMTKQPDLDRVPTRVRRLLRRCLEKNPKQRLRDIGDAVDLPDDPAPLVAEAGTKRSRLTPWVVSLFMVLIAAFALWAPWRGGRSMPDDVVRLTMETSPADMLGPELWCCRPTFTSLALSPDGKTVVFIGMTTAHALQLYKRTLDQGTAIPLAGTVGAEQPFFSPDGQWVGFMAGEKLKKVPLTGGPPLTICDVPRAGGYNSLWGASWSTTGKIVFVVYSAGTDLMEAPETGGTPKVLVRSDPSNLYSTPEFLPDGKTLLLTLRTGGWDTAQIVAGRLDTAEQHVVLKGGANARYLPTGRLVYLESGALMAFRSTHAGRS